MLENIKEKISKNTIIAILIFALISRALVFGSSLVVSDNIEKNWVHFDASWYLDIAKNGYDADLSLLSADHPSCHQGTGYCQRNFAFFPVYPSSVRIVKDITGSSYELSGLIVSNLFFIGSSLLIFILTKKIFNKRIAFISSLIFIFWPVGYVFSGIMTESTFIFFLLLSLLFTYNKKYLLSGLAGTVLSATRNTGILVLIPLIFIYLDQKKKGSLTKRSNTLFLLSMCLVPIGAMLFSVYLWNRVGDPIAFMSIQKYWEKPVIGLNPILAIPFSLFDYRLEGSIGNHIYNLVWVVFSVGLYYIAERKKILTKDLKYIMFWFLVPLTAGSILAIPRYLSVQFPTYIVLAKLLEKKRLLLILFIIVSAIGLTILSILYFKNYWITV